MPTEHQKASPADRHGGAMASAVRVVSLLTFCARLAGMMRDLVTARVFGDSALGSALRAAFAFPYLFVTLFGEGALSATFLPEYITLRRDKAPLQEELASVCMKVLALVTGSLTLIVEAVLIVLILTAEKGSSRQTSFELMALILPTLPIVCVSMLLGVILQAHGRFGPSVAAPLVLNLCQVCVALPFWIWPGTDRTFAAFMIGGSAVIAALVQITWATFSLRGTVHWRRAGAAAVGHARAVLKRFVPVVLGLGTLQINAMFGMMLVMWPVWVGATMLGHPVTLDPASNSILSYTQAIYQFPMGVFALSVSTAVFPLLARTANIPEEYASVLRRGLRLSLFVSVPAMIGIILTRHDLVYVLLSGGKTGFSAEGVERSAAVLMGYAPGMWAHSLNLMLTRAYYARQDTRTPLRAALVVMVLNLVLNLTLMWPLREAGFAWSTALCAMAQTSALLYFCRTKLGVLPFDRATVLGALRIVLAAGLMAAAVAATLYFWPNVQTWGARVVRLGACVAVGGGVYLAGSVVGKLPELRWLLARESRPPKAAGASDVNVG